MVQKKAIFIAPNTWYYRGYFLYHVTYNDTSSGWIVYSKFEDSKCKDFLFEATNLPSLVHAIRIFKEDINFNIVPEVAPSKFDTEVPHSNPYDGWGNYDE